MSDSNQLEERPALFSIPPAEVPPPSPTVRTRRTPAPRHRPARRGEVHRLTGWRCILMAITYPLLRLTMRTWRFRIIPEEEAILRDTTDPAVIVLWHNREFVVPEILRRTRGPGRVACLVSPSRTAAWLVGFLERHGLRCIRGSSTRGGVAATRELLKAHRAGHDLAVTPDGPDGPLYRFKRGTEVIARLTGGPILLLQVYARWSVRMPTWDRSLIPLPFSTIEIRCRRIESLHDVADERTLTEGYGPGFLRAFRRLGPLD